MAAWRNMAIFTYLQKRAKYSFSCDSNMKPMHSDLFRLNQYATKPMISTNSEQKLFNLNWL